MSDYDSISLRGVYRSPSHLPIWEVMDKAKIWEQVGVESVSLEYMADPPDAEAALFDGSIDFISGNHITPYALVAKGKPIVCLASPSNAVRDRVISPQQIADLAELRGKRIADQPLQSRSAGFQHPTGNHMLFLRRAGVEPTEVTWVELDASGAQLRAEQLEALKSGAADACFATGGTDEYERAGLHVLELDPLPMINGPTLTTSLDRLKSSDQLGERLVKALVLAIHFAKTHTEDTELILEELRRRDPQAAGASIRGLLRMPEKPYPDPAGVVNAFELCLMKDPEAKAVSPLALWDLHYLRELDGSGFIDQLYSA
ncbi:MAG TPA: ABC transporter substrate-binding protein [Bryobacteraceae bacterium]|nr:ABC transporter substrate-binding protein [Bryobacteraceae bacterium]